IQLKSGDSYLTTRRDGKEIFTIKSSRHIEYWRQRKYPVMLVARTSDGGIRWMDVRAYLRREHDAGREGEQIRFDGEPFTAKAVRTLRDTPSGAGSPPPRSGSVERLRALRGQLRGLGPGKDDERRAGILSQIAEVLQAQSRGELDEAVRDI